MYIYNNKTKTYIMKRSFAVIFSIVMLTSSCTKSQLTLDKPDAFVDINKVSFKGYGDVTAKLSTDFTQALITIRGYTNPVLVNTLDLRANSANNNPATALQLKPPYKFTNWVKSINYSNQATWEATPGFTNGNDEKYGAYTFVVVEDAVNANGLPTGGIKWTLYVEQQCAWSFPGSDQFISHYQPQTSFYNASLYPLASKTVHKDSHGFYVN
jgi:hypothetical protein